MSLSSAEIKAIVETLQESEWDQALVVVGDVQISVARNGAALAGSAPGALAAPVTAVTPTGAPVAASAPAPAAARVATPPAPVTAEIPSPATVAGVDVVDGYVVESPSVGVFWSASEPGAAPFVSVGSTVEPGDTLCIVEIMKLMNNVTSDVAGEVVAVHATNSAAVEYGTPLFTIRLKA